MNKKLSALAVAAAFGVPGTALAQASNVQLYGTISVSGEWAEAQDADHTLATTPNGSSIRGASTNGLGGAAVGGAYVTNPAIPGLDFPGRTRTQAAGSNFGVRGREDLGRGLYFGFQAELGLQAGGVTPVSGTSSGTNISTRNTGVWLGSNFGELGFGIWDSPYNINMGLSPLHAPYANPSTSMAAGFLGALPMNPGTISNRDVGEHCNAAGTFTGTPATSCLGWGTSFHRRVANSFWYQSPTVFGVRGRVQYGATSGTTANRTPEGANFPGGVTPQLWSVGVSWVPTFLPQLFVGGAWERHYDFVPAAARVFGGTGFNLGGVAVGPAPGQTGAFIPVGTANTNGINRSVDDAYSINLRWQQQIGPSWSFAIGGYCERLEYDWTYSGFVATNVTELKRDACRADVAFRFLQHTLGFQYGWARDLKGEKQGGAFNGNDSGAMNYIVGYAYSFSPRSSIYAYATFTENETNARYNGIVFGGLGPNAGADPRYYGIGLRHTF
jgi:predicted porin